MKISEIITEEIAREILGFKCIGRFSGGTGIQITEEGMYFYPVRATETGNVGYDLARFLFVDAWDYFEGKGWTVQILSNHVYCFNDKLNARTRIEDKFGFQYHGSRLHAMAATVAYMWEQEKKKDER